MIRKITIGSLSSTTLMSHGIETIMHCLTVCLTYRMLDGQPIQEVSEELFDCRPNGYRPLPCI